MSLVRLEVSICRGSEPIQGSVLADRGVPRQFCGWMELTEAIEAARGAQGPEVDARVRPPKD